MNGISNLNCILLQTDNVKSKMRSNISNLTLYGVTIINSIRDIDMDMIDKTNKVIILGSYAYDGLDDLKLYKALLGLEYYLITDDRQLATLMRDFCRTYVMDYTRPDSNQLYSILYDDRSEQSKYELPKNYEGLDVLANNILDSTPNENIKDICEDYLRLRDILRDKDNTEKQLTVKIRRLESQILRHLAEIDVSSRAYESLVSRVIELNKTLSFYEIEFSKDFYKKIQTNKYISRPKIIYLKEYQELMHCESFLNTLYNSLCLQLNKSCKIIRLHDTDDVVRIKSLEDDYKVVGNKFLEKDIISNNKILCYGNYQKLFDLLFTNKYTLDIVIVVDCKKYLDYTLSGSDILYFNMCRNSKLLDKFSLDEANTVTNNSGYELSWDTYNEYSEFRSDRDRFLFLSSRSVIKRIYSIVESCI